MTEPVSIAPTVAAGTRALDGITILDLTHIGAGPLATSMLGDMGAEVIKVEPRGTGDPTRGYDEVFPGADSSYFLGINRSKKSVALDLKSEAGMQVIHRLLDRCDVVIENYRPGALRRLGLDYDTVQRRKPTIVYCSISAFGPDGPYVDRPGMDIIVQGLGGIMGITGEAGRPPVKVGPPIADFMGSYLAAYGISLALLARERHGIGQLVTISLLDGQIAALANYITGFHVTGKPDVPQGGGHPQIVPYQVFAARDGYLIVACLTEGFWRNMCRVLKQEQLLTDPRFETNKVRTANRGELIPMLSEIFETKTRAEWVEILSAADVPCGPVNKLGDTFSDPQVQHNRMVEKLQHPKAGTISVPGVVVKMSATPGRISAPPPMLGEHTEAVLAGLGYSATEIAAMRGAHVI
ncbi:MAG: CoA:oxalate CoA-transferase [Ramlibacter sp.]|nr:CoA:oxalate CoA-transferase [Ramlibacter sp.]